MISSEIGKRLLSMAKEVLFEYVNNGKKLSFQKPDNIELCEKRGLFVTLKKKGELRGCIGYIVGFEPLYKSVVDLTISAAARDPRFYPVTKQELKDISVEISIMTEPSIERNPENIIMGVHGVIVKRGNRQGVYLPQVAIETNWTRDEFMDSLCESKAGIPRNSWRTGEAEIYTFSADIFSDSDNLNSLKELND